MIYLLFGSEAQIEKKIFCFTFFNNICIFRLFVRQNNHLYPATGDYAYKL